MEVPRVNAVYHSLTAEQLAVFGDDVLYGGNNDLERDEDWHDWDVFNRMCKAFDTSDISRVYGWVIKVARLRARERCNRYVRSAHPYCGDLYKILMYRTPKVNDHLCTFHVVWFEPGLCEYCLAAGPNGYQCRNEECPMANGVRGHYRRFIISAMNPRDDRFVRDRDTQDTIRPYDVARALKRPKFQEYWDKQIPNEYDHRNEARSFVIGIESFIRMTMWLGPTNGFYRIRRMYGGRWSMYTGVGRNTLDEMTRAAAAWRASQLPLDKSRVMNYFEGPFVDLNRIPVAGLVAAAMAQQDDSDEDDEIEDIRNVRRRVE